MNYRNSISVVFFISGHGFGHASRDVEVINALARIDPSLRIIVRSAVNPGLLERTLRAAYELRPGVCDSGIVQSSSVSHDDAATVREAIAFYSSFDDRVAVESSALADEGVRAIVGDIPPLAFAVAARIGVPSIAIANFTWDWIYETHPGLVDAAPWLLGRMREAYGRATLALELPFAGGLEVFPVVRKLPLIARKPAHRRDETREHFGIPRDRRAVLLSFGGYGMPSLDLTRVDCPDWSIVATDRVLAAGERAPANVVPVSEDQFRTGPYRYEDLVASVDVVFTKPGFGIISECVAAGTPLVYTSRGAFREYDVLVREMPNYLRCRFLEQTDLFGGRWRTALEGVLSQPAPTGTIGTDGAEIAAEAIRAFVN